jgi:hypothetical protein
MRQMDGRIFYCAISFRIKAAVPVCAMPSISM